MALDAGCLFSYTQSQDEQLSFDWGRMLSLDQIDPVGLEGTPATQLDVPDTPETKAMLALWKEKMDGSDLPRRSDFSPLEMKNYLAYIYIIEVLDGGADFLVRLAGTALTGVFGEDFTGAKFSDPRLSGAAWRLAIFRKAFDTLKPVSFRFRLGPVNSPRLVTENLILPVRDKNDGCIILMCVSILVGELDKRGRMTAL